MRIDHDAPLLGEAHPQFDPSTTGAEQTEWMLIVKQRLAPAATGDDGKQSHASHMLVLLIPPIGRGHEDSSSEQEESIYIKFKPRPDWLPWLRWPRVADGVRAVEVSDDSEWEKLAHCVETLQESVHQADAHGEAMAMNVLERIFLLVHGRQARHQQSTDRRIAKVTQYVKRQLGKDITIEIAASVVGLSPSRLSHLFREQLGVTFTSYVQMERLQRARLMLETSNRPTEAIARELGMEPAYFSAWFRKWSGLSPRSYRSFSSK